MFSRLHLHTQIVVAVFFACLSVLAIQMVIRQMWTLPTFTMMAEENDRMDLRRLKSQVKQEINALENLLYDNAVWDEMYRAAMEKDAAWFDETYFIPESYERLHINGWQFYDTTPELIAGFSLSETSGKQDTSLFETIPTMESKRILIMPQEVVDNDLQPVARTQFILLADKPAIILSHSIAPSEEKGESAGTAVLWRHIDDQFVSSLTPGIDGDISLLFGDSLKDISTHISSDLFSDSIDDITPYKGRLYISAKNEQGKVVFALSFPIRERPFDDQLVDSSLLAGILISIAILVLFYLYLRSQLVLPLQRLLKLVTNATQTNDFTARTNMHGGNEINQLGRRMDALFTLIQTQNDELLTRNQKLLRISNTDPLTGLANRRYLDQYLDTLSSHFATTAQSVALMIMDIDYFKAYNDHYGHSRGDEVLKQVARILEQSTHSATDLVSRYGGEEFVIVLQNTTSEQALKVANNLCSAVRNAHIEHTANPIGEYLTISVGLAAKPADEPLDADALFNQADTALYDAKHAGRDRVAQHGKRRTDVGV